MYGIDEHGNRACASQYQLADHATRKAMWEYEEDCIEDYQRIIDNPNASDRERSRAEREIANSRDLLRRYRIRGGEPDWNLN